MRHVTLLGVFVLLILVPLGIGSPVEGPSWSKKRVPPGTADQAGKVTEPGKLDLTKLFAAGQRACVMAIGDHEPIVDVEIKVYDSKNNLVAQDRGKDPVKDFVAVMWYPPRQEYYRIEILSYGTVENICSIAIR